MIVQWKMNRIPLRRVSVIVRHVFCSLSFLKHCAYSKCYNCSTEEIDDEEEIEGDMSECSSSQLSYACCIED